jgi:hypothetical protein
MPSQEVRTEKAYLGDAVYIDIDDALGVVLTTEDGIRATNRIVLEPEVLAAFDAWRAARQRAFPWLAVGGGRR